MNGALNIGHAQNVIVAGKDRDNLRPKIIGIFLSAFISGQEISIGGDRKPRDGEAHWSPSLKLRIGIHSKGQQEAASNKKGQREEIAQVRIHRAQLTPCTDFVT